jgi:hypothetical protein
MNHVKILKIISDFLHVSAFARMDYMNTWIEFSFTVCRGFKYTAR